MVSPTGAARKRLLGVALCALLALTVSAVPASAAQRESVCAGSRQAAPAVGVPLQ